MEISKGHKILLELHEFMIEYLFWRILNFIYFSGLIMVKSKKEKREISHARHQAFALPA